MKPCLASMLIIAALLGLACGPVPPPSNAYKNPGDLLKDLEARRNAVRSFRITGRVDHFGKEHRIQGKIFLFAQLPSRLRVELVSPFNSPLSVLTVDKDRFALHDLRQGRYFSGPAEPCNIARLIRIPLPAEDVTSILLGHTPIISGKQEITWDKQGFYRVSIHDQTRVQHMEIGHSNHLRPLMKSRLEDAQGVVFDLTYDRWSSVNGIFIPRHIRVKMPRHKADLFLRYDEDGVELNVDLPDTAWFQSVPRGITAQEISCN